MTKQQWPLATADEVAARLKADLAAACERIEVAGSVRRRKPEVSDIELLCIPRKTPVEDMFGTPVGEQDELGVLVHDLLSHARLSPRFSVDGKQTIGPLNKLLYDMASGMAVDLFSTTAEFWSMAMVVRTGPVDFNRQLAVRFRELGLLMHAYGGVERERSGLTFACPDEEMVFRLAELDYMPPELRERELVRWPS